ncbi:MAG TPA: AMP-binding protein, partial [Candidatus Sulfotelmatobacter sp.]|nr:AMP-binding protein [Candidatus Sulfotelmatobacter sp.]
MTRTPELSSNTFNIADEFVSRPAREHPDKLAILGVEREATYAELETEVNRVARALRDSGCKPGNRVLIALPDSFEFIAAFFGAAKIGAVAVPVNSMARTADYRHYLSNSGARFAMVHASILAEFASGIVAGGLELVVVFGR